MGRYLFLIKGANLRDVWNDVVKAGDERLRNCDPCRSLANGNGRFRTAAISLFPKGVLRGGIEQALRHDQATLLPMSWLSLRPKGTHEGYLDPVDSLSTKGLCGKA